jgi:nucleotide-binding universal stress UspA family protein
MKVLIAIKGTERASFFEMLLSFGCLVEADDVRLAHVVDVGPRSGIEGGRERFMVHRSLGAARSRQIEVAESEAAQAVLQAALNSLLAGGVPEERVHLTALHGRPNESLQQLAEEESIDLIVVARRAGNPGPHSLGKTARFLVDHAPRAALLVRSE